MPTASGRALPRGTSLDDFEIVEVVAERAGSVAYRATASDGAAVLLSEYMPARLAQRDADGVVGPRSDALAAYRRGLTAFVDEAQALRRCDHPALPKVLQVWAARGTAFCVLALPGGERLSEARAARNEPLAEPALRRLLDDLLGALEVWHREVGLHGAVSAANVLLRADGSALLLAPGAADRAVTDASAAGDRIAWLMTNDDPSFAPVEQIVPTADMPLAPSADLYALAGVARFCITGQLPPPALEPPGAAQREPLHEVVQRLQRDDPSLQYGAALLATLEAALAPLPADRPQNVAQFRAALAADPRAGAPPNPATTPAPAASLVALARARRWSVLVGAIGLLFALAVLIVVVPRLGVDARRNTGVVDAVATSPPPASASGHDDVAATPGRVATSPHEACGGRNGSALQSCMKTRCAQAQWKTHPQCEPLRRAGSNRP